MEETIKLSTVDRSKIKSIVLKYPEIMADNAEDTIKKEYFDIQNLKDTIHQYRDKIRELESVLEAKEATFNEKSKLFLIEFETITKEYTSRKSDIVINGDIVYDYSHR